MGLRSGLPHLGSPRWCVADLAAPIQLASAAQQPKIKSAHQPPRSYREQPVEAPQLADLICRDDLSSYDSRAHSVRLTGVVTSIRLENLYWAILAELSDAKAMTTSQLISK